MKQLGKLKRYKMNLTTLSPVFIGGGNFSDLSQLQYVLSGSELKILDESKFMKFLKNTNLLDKFINYVSTPQYNKNNKPISPTLSNWINQNFPKKDLDIYSRIDEVEIESRRNLNYVRSFIKTSNGRPYIPGSSIKGAIKTAMLSHLIKNDGLEQKKAEDFLKEQMKFIQISDTKSLPNSCLMYRQTAHQQLISDSKSIKRNGYLKIDYKLMNVDNDLKEILKEGLICTFYITIEDNFKYTIEDILNILNKFYTEVYDENKELNNLSKIFKTVITVKDCSPNINIGGQSGFNTKVILKALSANEIDYIKRKKESLNSIKSSRKHKHDETFIAPRCLRVVQRFKENDNTLMPLGWCNISIAK